ncbi:unnamed protein product [Lepidochelys olivacea]
MWVALPLCLLSALLAIGSALQCEVCASREQSCSGPLQPCAPSEGTCVTVVAEMRLGRIYHSSQFSIIRKFAESAIHTILQIIYEDIEQNRPQDRPLGHST